MRAAVASDGPLARAALEGRKRERERSGEEGRDKNGILTCARMLEDSSYNEVVRWGNEGDSFVVLEVNSPAQHPSHTPANNETRTRLTTRFAEREIHKTHPAETLQAQQLCIVCATAE